MSKWLNMKFDAEIVWGRSGLVNDILFFIPGLVLLGEKRMGGPICSAVI